MKIYRIFRKNMKTVSRNWSYFFVLVICPIVLILSSGGMLSSFDPNQATVGIVNSEDTCNLNIEGVSLTYRSVSCYKKVEKCLEDLGKSKVSACLEVEELDSNYLVNVYLDNSRRVVQYYSKQLILEKFLGSQTEFIENTKEELSAKLFLYSSALGNAKSEIESAKEDLDFQQKSLEERKQSLSGIKQDFELIYFPLKELEPSLKSIKDDFYLAKNSLDANISFFKQKKRDIEAKISDLKLFLSSRLSNPDYQESVGLFETILENLNEIEVALDQIQGVSNSEELFQAISLIETITPKLDSIYHSLQDTENDLDLAIEKTKETKVKLSTYSENVDQINSELQIAQKEIGRKTVSISFLDNFRVSSDPVMGVFPLLVALIVTFTSLILSNLFVIKQSSRASYFRELISPTKDSSFLFADYFLNLFLVFLQVTVLLLIGVYWVGVSLTWSSLWIFYLIIFLSASTFIFLGMSLGYVLKSSSLSMLLTIFGVMLFLILSDLIVPIPLLSYEVRMFVGLNPFVILSNLLKESLVLNEGISFLSDKLFLSGIFFFVSFFVAYFSKKASKKRLRN